MSPLKHSNNFAARMGRWSANHWKTAVFGWLAFVVAVRLRRRAGRHQVHRADRHQRRRVPHRRPDHRRRRLPVDKGESTRSRARSCCIQSKTLTADDPAFKAAIEDVVKTRQRVPAGRKIARRSTPVSADLVSEDGHSAMVQFAPEGTYEEAVLYIDKIAAAVDKVEARHRASTIQLGSVSTDEGARRRVPERAGEGRDDRDPAHDRRSCCSCSARSSRRWSRCCSRSRRSSRRRA